MSVKTSPWVKPPEGPIAMPSRQGGRIRFEMGLYTTGDRDEEASATCRVSMSPGFEIVGEATETFTVPGSSSAEALHWRPVDLEIRYAGSRTPPPPVVGVEATVKTRWSVFGAFTAGAVVLEWPEEEN